MKVIYNRLKQSNSPYLLQHAENPVDWYEWRDEAFARAAAEDKPVFLSIGYATCHWCHVMAHESFADPAVAAVLNRDFVAIKVDREERPDLDDQYMTVSQLLTGSGGWPLNLFLTPNRLPFYATTYLPKTPRSGSIGFIQLLERIAAAWHEQRAQILSSCASICEDLQRLSVPLAGDLPGPALQQQAFLQLQQLYDHEAGGFGQGHKFPMPVNLQFLLRVWRRQGDQSALSMVTHTLRRMADGGIHDQLGGGFHRYTVDRFWLEPHFEKMLYDQALLAYAYLEAFQATGQHDLLAVAEAIFGYLERDLLAPGGAFFCAEDADSAGEEGQFYIWTPAQIAGVLGEEDGSMACQIWGVTAAGNFAGRNILHRPVNLDQVAGERGIPVAVLQQQMVFWQQQLLADRSRRLRPLRDEKILTEWNGLAIAALAKGYAVTGQENYLRLASQALAFLIRTMVQPDGRLMRRWYQDDLAIPALLDDYAALLWGIVELHQATLAPEYLTSACHWAGELTRLFLLPSGANSAVAVDAEQLLVTNATASDGVIPPGNALAAASFLRLAAITREESYAEIGKGILRAFAGSMTKQPAAYLGLWLTHDYLWEPAPVVSVHGAPDRDLRSWIKAAATTFSPGLVLRVDDSISAQQGALLCSGQACRADLPEEVLLQSALDELWTIK